MSHSATRMKLMVLVLALWFAFLIHSVRTSANPVILSRPQLLSAPVIVSGRWLDDPPRIKVERVWWGDASFADAELAMVGPEPGRKEGKLLVPLESAGESTYRVVRVPPEPGFHRIARDPRVYRATDAVVEQLEGLLASRRRQQGSLASPPAGPVSAAP